MSAREFRVIGSSELRTAGARSISGYAACFGTLSEPLNGFRESIRPGAFSRSLRQKADVRMLINHDPSRLLARTRSGTLQLNEDSKGLHFRADMPDTTYAHDLMESIRRGDISQCSFGFVAQGEEWNRARTERTLTDVDIFDTSVVTYPAYSDTSVASSRSLTLFDEVVQLRYYVPGGIQGRHARVNDDEWRVRAQLRLAKARLR